MLLDSYPKPEKKVLIGKYCQLIPFNKELHAARLHQVFLLDDKGIDWTYMPYGPFHSEKEFLSWVDQTCMGNDPLFYAVCVGDNLDPVGMISLLNIEAKHGRIEIGHVHFSPLLQRTPASTEATYLLMNYAFETLGYRRLEWKCDNGNNRSKDCAKRLGFSFEGVFRQHWVMKSRNRDTAWLSIIDKEWGAVKVSIQKWLDPSNFSDSGIQIKKLGG